VGLGVGVADGTVVLLGVACPVTVVVAEAVGLGDVVELAVGRAGVSVGTGVRVTVDSSISVFCRAVEAGADVVGLPRNRRATPGTLCAR
jgi:hypothetical protein